jgi:tripartite-type tricarboxylate transporter receptor subunit TctC
MVAKRKQTGGYEMSPSRRVVIGFAAAMAASVSLSGAVHAQTFTKTVRIVVPFAPGGTSDILARLIAPKMQEAIGQTVVVENKPGAGGHIGAFQVANADKDGHTLLLVDNSTLAIGPSMIAKMTYNPVKDLAPVGMILFAPYVLAAHPSLPAKSVDELVAYAKANPGKIAFANAGIGVANHIAGLQLTKAWGIDVIHVPYKGGADAIKAVVGGEGQLILNGATATAGFVKQGTLKGLAVTGDQRVEAIKDVPTFTELKMAAADSGTWQGVYTSGGTPPAMVERLNAELNKALAQPDVAAKIRELGGQVKAGKAADLATWLATSTESYAKIIKDAGIKPE